MSGVSNFNTVDVPCVFFSNNFDLKGVPYFEIEDELKLHAFDITSVLHSGTYSVYVYVIVILLI